ncbi:MAG: endonuclease domain-containing protein [Clostridia bacterium]|nr:endonuclease domain-containing protein [Clostridia bacterium]
MRLQKNSKLKSLSNNLRKNATKQENKLWYLFLSKHKIKFCRQYIIGNYIVDFYCQSKKIAIELDGGQHYEEEALKYDNERTNFLNGLGVRVLRFTNTDIEKNFDLVCKEIEFVLSGIK